MADRPVVLVSGGLRSSSTFAMLVVEGASPVGWHVPQAAEALVRLRRMAAEVGGDVVVVEDASARAATARALALGERVYVGTVPAGVDRAGLAAPFAAFTGDHVVRSAARLGIPLSDVWDCAGPGPSACRRCGPCRKRAEACEAAGRLDPDAEPPASLERRPGATTSPVYLAGHPFSGSTLLSMLLAASPSVVALGETAALTIDVSVGQVCSCGASYPACPFWGPHIGGFGRLDRLDVDVVRRHLVDGSPSAAASRYANDTMVFLDQIGASMPGSVLLDSSKYPGRLRWLAEVHSGWRMLHLVRDPRAAVVSTRTRLGHSLPARDAVERWRRSHEAAEALVPTFIADRLVVRYEDLVASPLSTVRSIWSWLGVDEGATGEPQIGHHVRGNPIRFDPGAVTPDVRWRALPQDDIVEAEDAAGRWLAHYGYDPAT